MAAGISAPPGGGRVKSVDRRREAARIIEKIIDVDSTPALEWA